MTERAAENAGATSHSLFLCDSVHHGLTHQEWLSTSPGTPSPGGTK